MVLCRILEGVMSGIMMATPLVPMVLDGTKTQTRRMGKRWLKVKPGDVLAMREAYRPGLDHKCHRIYLYRGNMEESKVEEDGYDIWERRYQTFFVSGDPFRWIPAVHMPLNLVRVHLHVVRVWQERPMDISSTDATAEGMAGLTMDGLLELAKGSKSRIREAFKLCCGLTRSWDELVQWWNDGLSMVGRFQIVLDVLGCDRSTELIAIEFRAVRVGGV